ncbi:MAG: hypothetical protein M0P14_00795 [Alkaliphilus sp.]|nr:hypothetical protein [Alkaliphilus sp.]
MSEKNVFHFKRKEMTMAAFDPTKDKKLASKVLESKDGGTTSIVVSAHEYNGGEPKIQIGRIVFYKNGNTGHKKVGRMTLEESMAVAGIIPEIMSAIK